MLSDLFQLNGNLSTLLEAGQQLLEPSQRPLLQELTYGSVRHFPTLEFLAQQRLKKPLRAKDHDVYCLILLGLYQLRYMRIAPHAAINETVDAAPALGKQWAKGFVNAVLRNYQRDTVRESRDQAINDLIAPDLTAATDAIRYNMPEWLLQKFSSSWPEHWQQLAVQSNHRPPMVLRVNTRIYTVGQYLEQLQKQGIEALQHVLVPSAIVLSEPIAVEQLPGFAQGHVSVQDAAAQLATVLLEQELREFGHQHRILDACAAPGGKTGHLLEQSAAGHLSALDISESRLQRVGENLERLGVSERATLITADAAAVDSWWDGQLFDLILLDAPCSGTGVIRRQPDIKLLRTAKELSILASMQQNLAESLWPLLKPGGKLLYVTCSVLPEENRAQAKRLKAKWPDAVEVNLIARVERLTVANPGDRASGLQSGSTDVACSHDSPGFQVLTGDNGMDGFYYWLVEKSVAA